jgi:phosphohistidine phosphatase
MKEIFLVRHAKADYPEACQDFDRPLTARGRKDAEKLGAELFKYQMNPDLVICSSALRTRETYSILSKFFQKSPVLVFADELYFSDVVAYQNFIAEAEDRFSSLMFVGHNPSISLMSYKLDEAGRGHDMRTSNAVHLIFDTIKWADIRRGRINLILLP